jgi:hypothetical protein
MGIGGQVAPAPRRNKEESGLGGGGFSSGAKIEIRPIKALELAACPPSIAGPSQRSKPFPEVLTPCTEPAP